METLNEKPDRSNTVVMYLCVRASLPMSPGKIGAQCSHGCQGILVRYYKELWEVACGYRSSFSYSATMQGKMVEWLEESTKVVLSAPEEVWEELKKLPNSYVVIDGGYTEIPPNTETVISFWPMKKSEAPELIKGLRTLK